MTVNQVSHKSVMLEEVLQYLEPQNQGTYVDATFGAGGYSESILEKNSANILYSFDRDENVQKFADKLSEKYPENFTFINTKFSNLTEKLAEENVGLNEVDGIVFDLGISSMQVDEGERGFSFSKTAKLDMRMGFNDISAYEIINEFEEETLANIIYEFGEERDSRKIARNIVKHRNERKIETTTELARIVEQVKKKGKSKIHPATKTFQALRIYINKELEELRSALSQAKNLLKKGGKLVVVSFHSLEDTIVKHFFKSLGKLEQTNRYLPAVENIKTQEFKILAKGIKPAEEELQENVRSRSAILRVGIKL